MRQPGYQEGDGPRWWWKVARHLDEAQLALVNAMAHNLDDQTAVLAIQDKLREGQAMLLEIFRARGLLPAVVNGKAGGPLAVDLRQVPQAEAPQVEETSPSELVGVSLEDMAGAVVGSEVTGQDEGPDKNATMIEAAPVLPAVEVMPAAEVMDPAALDPEV